jgi:hypothetical protein
MPISNQVLGSRRRIHISRKALKDADLSGAIDQYILNIIPGSGMFNPQKPNIIPNLASAQGQGTTASKLFKGRVDIQTTLSTLLTTEAFAMHMAASLPFGGVAAAASGYAHTAYFDQTANQDTLSARTVEEHHDGSDVTSYMDYMLGQVICTGWRFNVNRGSDFSTIEGDWVARDNAAGHDLSSKDVVGNWPADPGFTAPKIGVWVEKNATGYDTKWDTTISTPGTLGTPYHDLTSPLNLSEYYETLQMSWASNIDIEKLYAGGTSTDAGIKRDVDGAVIVIPPTIQCALSLDLTSHATLQEFINYFKDFDNADPDSYSLYICGVSDKLAATGCYYGFVVVLPACYPADVTLPTDNGPTMANVTLEAMADKDANPQIKTAAFDADSGDYYATS